MLNLKLYRNEYDRSGILIANASEEDLISIYLEKLVLLLKDNKVENQTAKIVELLNDMFNNFLKFNLYLIEEPTTNEICVNEMIISFLLQLLYDLTFLSYQNYYVPVDNILWFQQVEEKNEIYSHNNSNYIISSFDLEKSLHNMEENDIYICDEEKLKSLKIRFEKTINLIELPSDLIVEINNCKYINKFQLHYLNFLTYNYTLIDDLKKNLKNYNITSIQNNYNATLTGFANRYNRLLLNASIYIEEFNIDEMSLDYYLFIYQLKKNTHFITAYLLTNVIKHDYTFAFDNVEDFERNIRFNTTSFGSKEKHLGIEYGEDMDYYLNYISYLLKIDFSPTLFKSFINYYFAMKDLVNIIGPLKNAFDFSIHYILKHTLNFSATRDTILKTLNNVISIEQLGQLNDLLNQNNSNTIIGNDFQNLCFLILQKLDKSIDS